MSTPTSDTEIQALFTPFCGDSAPILLAHLSTLPPTSPEIPLSIQSICGDSKQVSALIRQYAVYRHTMRQQLNSARVTVEGVRHARRIDEVHGSTRVGGDASGASCECQGQFHKLKTSCPRCGRVICEVESLPCWFCSKSNNLTHKQSSSDILIHPKSHPDDRPNARADAESLRQRLQQYALEDTKRTKVTDIAGDFAQSNWDSREMRELKARKKAEVDEAFERKRGHVVTIDLGKGKIEEEGRDVQRARAEIQRVDALESVERAEGERKIADQAERRLRQLDLKYEAPTYVERDSTQVKNMSG